MSEETNVRHQ